MALLLETKVWGTPSTPPCSASLAHHERTIQRGSHHELLPTDTAPWTQRLWLAAKTTDLSHGIAILHFARLCCTLQQDTERTADTGMPYAKIYRGGTPVIKNNRSFYGLITVALLI